MKSANISVLMTTKLSIALCLYINKKLLNYYEPEIQHILFMIFCIIDF